MVTHCKEIIKKLATQAKNGRITIGDGFLGYWGYFIRFNIQLEGEEKVISAYPTFQINNNEEFFKNLAEYLKIARKFYIKDKSYFDLADNSFDEKLIMDILINATNFDMQNMEQYLKQRTQMLQSNLESKPETIGEYKGLAINMEISKNKSNLEAPYKFSLTFNNEDEKFALPSITFAIVDNICYLYAVQAKKEKQTNKLAKQLDRHFRKLNKDVDSSDLTANISTNALVSLVVFIEYLKSLNITEIHAPNFMPIRYNSNKVAGCFVRKDKNQVKEFLVQHDKNQYNITNKLMNLILRYNHHFPTNVSDYDDFKQEMYLELADFTPENENIIYDLQNSIYLNKVTKNELN